MTTDICPVCLQLFEFADIAQMHFVWDDVLAGWLPICDPCADAADLVASL